MSSSSKLFTPFKVRNSQLRHRIVLAPLTRQRASEDHVPASFSADYYAQRASVPGTLLISEATLISPKAGGKSNAPGIYTAAQIAAWKKITAAVHEKGSFIYLQLWALGRTANLELLKKEFDEDVKVKAPSDIPMDEGSTTPVPLSEEEIQELIKDYTQGAKNAIEAGFDGVEVHGANGYLIDQFFQDVSNNRTDKWGGSIENRARFGLEVTKAIVDAIGADRTAIRLSPFSDFQSMRMADPVPQFSYITEQLKALDIAYVHLIIEDSFGPSPKWQTISPFLSILGDEYPVLIAGGFTPENVRHVIDEVFKEKNLAAVFGRAFISNPDLVYRVKEGIKFAPYEYKTFYHGNEEGYSTYPFSKEFAAVKGNL